MRFEWVLQAEATAMDARGALTAIGIEQNVSVVEQLPALMSRSIIACLAIDAEDEGTSVKLQAELVRPSGDSETVFTGILNLGPKPWPDLPGRAVIQMPIAFEAREVGTHTVNVEASQIDADEDGDFLAVAIHVVNPPS